MVTKKINGLGIVTLLRGGWFVVERDQWGVWRLLDCCFYSFNMAQRFSDQCVADSALDRDLKVVDQKELWEMLEGGKLELGKMMKIIMVQ